MVYEDAGELVPDRFFQKRRRDRGIHPAGEGEQNLSVPDFFPDRFYRGFGVAFHRPVSGAAADFVKEVMKHFQAVFSVHDFRVELHSVEPAGGVFHGRYGAVGSVGG